MKKYSAEAFIKALTILSKDFENGLEESFFFGAEHDQIFIWTKDEYEFSDEELSFLEEEGFSRHENGGWSYFT